MKTPEEKPALIEYIETPRQCKTPIKIDAILEARLRAFKRAARVRKFSFKR